MSLVERVQQCVAANEPQLNNDPEFVKLRDFYHEMQQAGIAKKATYSLPPLDTVGRRVYQLTASKTQR